MQRLEERAKTELLICDGGMGTQLHARGLAPGECPEKWCLEKPGLVRSVHQAYRDAGSLIVETMMAIEECCVAVRAVRENTGLTCLASFTFDPQPDGGYASMMGVTPEQFAEQALAAGAQIVGANCGTGPDHMIAIIGRLRAVTKAPLIAMPNAGMPELVCGETVFPESPEEMASKVGRLVAAGASIIGGCCGTTPAHIAALARQVKMLR